MPVHEQAFVTFGSGMKQKDIDLFTSDRPLPATSPNGEYSLIPYHVPLCVSFVLELLYYFTNACLTSSCRFVLNSQELHTRSALVLCCLVASASFRVCTDFPSMRSSKRKSFSRMEASSTQVRAKIPVRQMKIYLLLSIPFQPRQAPSSV